MIPKGSNSKELIRYLLPVQINTYLVYQHVGIQIQMSVEQWFQKDLTVKKVKHLLPVHNSTHSVHQLVGTQIQTSVEQRLQKGLTVKN